MKELRPYQQKALDEVRGALSSGYKRVICQGPTAFGKTLWAAKVIQQALEKGNSVIFTAPAISLIDQTVAAFEEEGITGIGVMQANHPRTNPIARIQVASVQTLARRQIPRAALIIVDECHIDYQVIRDLMDERQDVYFIGLSATPWSRGLGLRWEKLIIPITTQELIDQGYLSQFRVYAPDVPNLKGVKTIAGEYSEKEVAEIMGDHKLVGSAVDTWLARGENRPTLCFGVNCAHAEELAQEFAAKGVAAGYCDANTDRVEMARLERRFRAGEIRVVCSVRKITTGVDWPVSCISDCAPTKSESLHVQKIGRGLRVNPGTEDLIVFDHAGNTLRLGLITDIHHETLDNTKPSEKREKPKKKKPLPKPCSKCGVLFTGLECPSCGHVRKRRSGIECGDGELSEVITNDMPRQPTKSEKQKFWSMALYVDSKRKKNGKLALALYRGKFDEWPNGLVKISTPPDNAFKNYETYSRIRYAKSKKR